MGVVGRSMAVWDAAWRSMALYGGVGRCMAL